MAFQDTPHKLNELLCSNSTEVLCFVQTEVSVSKVVHGILPYALSSLPSSSYCLHHWCAPASSHEILKHSSLLLHRLTFPSAQISPYIDPCESFSILRVIHLVGTSTFTYLSVTCNLSPICIPTQPSLSLPINLVINLVCFKIKYLLLFWKVGTELGNYDHVSLCLLQQCLAHSRWRGNSVLFIEGWIKTCIYVNTCPDIFSHS